MTEKELIEIKKILGLDDLKNDIRELRKDFKELDRKLSTFWYKVVFVLISLVVSGFILQLTIKYF